MADFPALPARQLAQMGDVDTNPVHMTAEEVYWHVQRVAFLWGRSSGSWGEHPKGLALDFSVLEYGNGPRDPGPAHPSWGNQVANYLWANRARLGLWYAIWNRQIISTNRSSYAFGKWTRYTGDNPHTDHVHASFYAANVYRLPAKLEEDDDMPTVDDLFNTEAIPNKNKPGGKQAGKLTLAQFCTNVEATQDAHSRELDALHAKLDALLARGEEKPA